MKRHSFTYLQRLIRPWGKTLPRSRVPQRQEGARRALLVLTLINLLNFADRYVPSSVKELLKEDLDLTDTETALPTTGMVLVYMVSSVFFGVLNDRGVIDRRALLAAGVAFWSLATALAGLAQDLPTLVLFRSLVGVGEAAYGNTNARSCSKGLPPAAPTRPLLPFPGNCTLQVPSRRLYCATFSLCTSATSCLGCSTWRFPWAGR